MLKTILALAWVCVCSFSLHLAMAQQPQAPAQQAAAAVVAEPEAPRVVLQGEQAASVLRLMKFSGALRDRAGNPRTGAVGLTFGAVGLTFAFYKDQHGGSTALAGGAQRAARRAGPLHGPAGQHQKRGPAAGAVLLRRSPLAGRATESAGRRRAGARAAGQRALRAEGRRRRNAGRQAPLGLPAGRARRGGPPCPPGRWQGSSEGRSAARRRGGHHHRGRHHQHGLQVHRGQHHRRRQPLRQRLRGRRQHQSVWEADGDPSAFRCGDQGLVAGVAL